MKKVKCKKCKGRAKITGKLKYGTVISTMCWSCAGKGYIMKKTAEELRQDLVKEIEASGNRCDL